jgi:spermidine synthase
MAPKNKSILRIHSEWLNSNFGYFYTVSRRLHSCKTDYQKLELVDTGEFGRVLMLDGITQVAQTCEFAYHEPMVHPAMCTHPCPRRVLVIGGGDGGILREVLKYPCVESVVLAELDEGVITFSKKYLPSIHKGAFSDPRLAIHVVDGRKYVEEHAGCFDVVIMDVTDPFGPSKYLYTKDFFFAVKRSFRSTKGVFAMHTESPIARPKTFSCIQHTLRTVFLHARPLYAYIQMYAILWSITVSSEGSDTSTITPAAIDRKLSVYKIKNLRFYNGSIHQASQAAWPYITSLLLKKSRVLTDAHPDIPDEIVHN